MGGSARDAVSPGAGVVAGRALRMASMSHAHTLINDMALGRPSGLEQFYDRYVQLVYNLVFRIVRNRADADEIVQGVFLQVWRDAGRYDPGRGSPEAWVVTLARTRAIDALRTARRGIERVHTTLPRDLADAELPGAARLPERQRVTGALDELAPAQRDLLELAYYEGLTQTEIAAR